MAIVLEQLVKQLTDLGIVAPGKLQDFLPPKTHPKTPEELLRQLVEQNQLTRFQAQQVLGGKGKGLVLGDYVILDKLGAGGMGDVFKARHRHMDRVVALKVVSPRAMKDEAAVKRFEREVKAAARLEHPNIVTAFDSRHDRGIHYLVMQYVEGVDLSGLVKQQGRLPVDLAIQCILQAARGLAYAHGEGVVHRDIKPANLLLDKKGTIKILDMGLARLDDASVDNLTGTEQVMGTVDYMSPEQAASTHAVDARADIYSLGCTLWFLLNDRKIYEGDTLMSRMLKHREAPIPSPCAARDDVPYALEELYQRMVAKLPEQRHASMLEVVRELESLQANTSGLSRLAASDDSAVNAFREFTLSLEPGTSVRERTFAQPKTSLPGGDALTVDYRDKSVGTDPKSELSVKPLAKPRRDKKKSTRFIPLAACVVGALAVLLGAIVILKNQQGDGVGRGAMGVPKGVPAEQRNDLSPIAGKLASKKGPGVPVKPPALANAPFDAQQARKYQEAWSRYLKIPVTAANSVGMEMVLIPPGEFLMGSTAEQLAAATKMGFDEKRLNEKTADLRNESPQHGVILTKPFLCGATEVTIGQFEQFVAATNYVTEPERDGGGMRDTEKDPTRNWRTPGGTNLTDDWPVTQITWNDAIAFCNWLSAQEKHGLAYDNHPIAGLRVLPNDGYRLPSEAQWEYACRAGTVTVFHCGDDPQQLEAYAWFTKNSGLETHAVGERFPNAFGLFDMQGNAAEWCQDFLDEKWYEKSPRLDPAGPVAGKSRVNRGGHASVTAVNLRSARRFSGAPTTRAIKLGFRVVRVLNVPDSSPTQ